MRTANSIDVPGHVPLQVAHRLRNAFAAALHRARPKSAVTLTAGVLSALLHIGLLLVLMSSGGGPGDPIARPVVLVENFAPRSPVRETPRTPAPEPPPLAAEEEPAPPHPKQTQDPSHAAALADLPEPLDPPEIVTPALTADIDSAALSFSDETSADPAPPVPATIDLPRAREMEITPDRQAALIERLERAAQALTRTAEAEVAWQENGREYRALLRRDATPDSMALETVSADVTTIEQGMSMQTKLLLSRLAFSQFTQVVDRWDPNVQLHDDEIVGRFHSNSALFIGYDSQAQPKFTGKVTTAARSLRYANGSSKRRRAEMFQGGLETFADRIELPKHAPPFALEPPDDDAHVHQFAADAHITLHGDGSYSWQSRKSEVLERRQYVASRDVYLLATADATLFLRGTVRGRVLAYSPKRIVIEGSLTYATDPRANDAADDYLGLVSDGNVEIARAYVTGRGDLKIDAAIFARRRFAVPDFERRRAGTLWIYGSLTAGSITATEPRYATKVEFDPRFDRVRPPGFPSTNRFELASWDGAWRAVNDESQADVVKRDSQIADRDNASEL